MLEKAMEARRRWLNFNAGDYTERFRVARWLAEEGRHEESLQLWEEANEVDPFRRKLHYHWGLSLTALGRFEEALREFEVGLRVPWALEFEAQSEPEPTWSWQALEAELHGEKARALVELDRKSEAAESAQKSLELDPECKVALEVLDRMK